MNVAKVEKERKRRIMISIWAYAYEFENKSIVSDEVFDTECKKVDIFLDTGRKLLDDFFLYEFDPSTGMWIHKHPELEKIKILYKNYFSS